MSTSTNRVFRATFMVTSTKTASHIADVAGATGSKNRYDAARPDTLEPENRHYVYQDRYITQEN